MSSGYILFLVVGRLLIFTGQKFASQNEIKIKFLNKLLSCSFCTGVWVYTIMSALLRYYVFEDLAPYIPLLSELIAGCFSSALVFYLESGWKANHEVIVI